MWSGVALGIVFNSAFSVLLVVINFSNALKNLAEDTFEKENWNFEVPILNSVAPFG